MPQTTPTRIALITGASRGIGACAARRIAAQGRQVVLVSRSEGPLEEVAATIRNDGGLACVRCCDVNDHLALARMIEEVAEEFGRLDILVNNAGLTRDNLLLRMTDDEFDQVIHVNLRSAFVACRTALRPMMRNRFGRIINISSVAGVVGNYGQTNYSSAKAGLIGLTKTIAKEMASKGITANAVAPGFIDTAMTVNLPQQVKDWAKSVTPLKRFGQPDEVAAAIAFLASDDSAYITGQVLAVDGGMTM
ncbi:MAG: 3-oxoacyl-[acyl-carrier-protein] reductase [Phycisphaeraceae bacterium]|nr:3-oxoacyl-[acyl-carrier-protein] reductase [Phycisphaeraceae bacterium]